MKKRSPRKRKCRCCRLWFQPYPDLLLARDIIDALSLGAADYPNVVALAPSGPNGEQRQALWLGRRGRRLNPQIVERNVREYSRIAGTRQTITPHALRRACASHMLRGGAHPAQVQALLGHSSLRTLSQYLCVTISDLKKAHEQSKPGR